MKVIKRVGLVFVCLLLCVCLLLVGFCIYHRYCLSVESSILCNSSGQLVEVSGHRMNLYMEGSGDKTLVFLSGTGTPSPMYDFKPLYRKLSDRYRIVVVEKFGYGYSDECSGERSLDVVVDQSRSALVSGGVAGPYILVPHSSSGAEAIWWANHYPDEVEAIVGIDANVPAQYDYYPVSLDSTVPMDVESAVSSLALYDFFFYDIGLIRLVDASAMLPSLSSDLLTDAEKEQYKALAYAMYCRGSGATWARETIMTPHSLAVLKEYWHGPVPDVPTLMFVSSGQAMEPVFGSDYSSIWRSIHSDYVDRLTRGAIIYVDCGHYMHAEEPDLLAGKIVEFIDSLG